MTALVRRWQPGPRLVLAVLGAALLFLMLLSLTVGRYPVPARQILRILFLANPARATQPYADAPWVVIEIVRLPRILAVTLCGIGLGMAGTATQGIFRNPLVSPEIMGVSSGASLGGAIGIVLSLYTPFVVGLAFALGFSALILAFVLARSGRQTGTVAIVLAGMIVAAFFSAAVGLIEYLADPQTKLPSVVYWLLGSFAGVTYQKVAIIAAATLVAAPVLLGLSWRINLLSLGDTDAASLGANVEKLRWTVVGLIALLVAAQVSISGVVGWVGLVVPHISRAMVGPEHSKLLPASALAGGFFLLAMDDIARSAVGTEVPIGLLTAGIGTPFFALLFYRQMAKGWVRE